MYPMQQLNRSQSVLVDTYAQFPFKLVRGEGVFVYDESGKRYLDFYGGHAVSLLGHSPKEIVQAITKQAETLMFYSNVAAMEIRETAAKALVEFCPPQLHHVFFCNSGAEAIENALKLSIEQTGRSRIAALKGGFHGRTLLASAVTDNEKWHARLKAWMGPVLRLHPNVEENISVIDETIASVIVEPIQSIAGVVVLTQSYLQALRERCDQVGAMLIFDEIQTGMGRTGVPFVAGSCGVLPDMMTLAKGLASGFPIGALLMNERVSSKVQIGDLGSTFGGGPVAMAAMLRTVELIGEQSLVENAKKIGEVVKSSCVLPGIEEVRGEGCLLGLRFAQDAKPIYQSLLKKNIITGTSGDSRVLRLLPPITIQEEQVAMLREALGEILETTHH